MIKVSIIIPVYNSKKYLRECLDSVLNQTLEDIEIICVNDGSSDNSIAILREYEKKDARIRILNKTNEGYGCAMNDGIEMARGEYIGIVESDDYILPRMYEILYKAAKEYDLDIVKSDFYRFYDIDGKRKIVKERLCKNDMEYYGKVINPSEELKAFDFMINTWTGIYRKSFLDYFNIRHNDTLGASFQDNGFWFQTFINARRIYFTDEAFYMNRRDNPDSSVMQKRKVYCINDEYRFIYDILNRDQKQKEKFIYVYSKKRFRNYLWNYGRIDKKSRKEYIRKISEELNNAKELNEINEELFTKEERIMFDSILKYPFLSYLLLNARGKASKIREKRRIRKAEEI